MDDSDETPELTTTDPEMRQLLGMFDVPAFARRGQELEHATDHLHARCRREREAMLDMVHLRLRQWGREATGPEDGVEMFAVPPEALRIVLGLEAIAWSAVAGAARRRMIASQDLIASVSRFNRRWQRFLTDLKLDPINQRIEHYNRYYLLEKECVFGSSRVASRGFEPRKRLTPEVLLEDHPFLPEVGRRPS